MVAAVIVCGQLTLAIDGAAELAPQTTSVSSSKPALLQVLDQGRTGLIDVLALPADLLRQAAVLVPAAMHELHEAHTALGHSPGEQTVRGKAAVGAGLVNAVHVEHVFRLVAKIGQLGHATIACGRPSRIARCGC